MFRRVGLTIGAIAVLSVVLVGCGSKPVVGVLLPTTGEAGTYGESIESGIRLAISDARDREELPKGFDVVWVDTQSDPDRAVSELRRLASERGVKMVIAGATSTEAQAIVEVLDELEVVCLSPTASTPGISQRSKLFFRIFPSDELEGHTAARFMFDRLGQDADRGLLRAGRLCRRHRTGVRESVRRGPRRRDRRADRSGRPRLAVRHPTPSCRAAASARSMSSAMRQQILEVDHLTSGRPVTRDALSPPRPFSTTRSSTRRVRRPRESSFPLPPFDRTSDKEPVLGFVNRYMDALGKAPDVFAAHGYDAMWLTIQVMTIADPPDTNQIRKAFHFGMNELMGVTGPILFDDYGDVKHYPKMFIVNEGQVHELPALHHDRAGANSPRGPGPPGHRSRRQLSQ